MKYLFSISALLLLIFPSNIKAQTCPDLIVTSLTVSVSPPNISYSFTIENIGTGPTDLSTVGFQTFLSADQIYNNAGDIAAGGLTLANAPIVFNPADTYTTNFSATPSSIDVNTHPYLTAMIDHLSIIPECDENNNTIATLIIPPPPIPTLSQWGLIILLTGILIVGLVFMRKSKALPLTD